MNTRLTLIFVTLLVSLAGVMSVQAADLSAVTERMKDRVEAVDKLKEAGKVGENNQGFLDARSELNEGENRLLKAENSDRKTLYQAVAGRTNQSLEEVGRQRAIRIAKIAKQGVWLQNADGEWYRK